MYMVLNNKLRRRCLVRILGRWLTGSSLNHVSIFQGDKSRHQGHRTNSMLVAEETVSRRGTGGESKKPRNNIQSNQNLNNYTANKSVVVPHFIFTESLS